MNKLKLEIMDEDFLQVSKIIIKDIYPDYFIGEEVSIEDESKMIEIFDTVQTIINKRHQDDYERASYEMGYYQGRIEGLSDSDKKII